ncbi:hypothetical protein M9H77_06346 [Catharanthus roseus]|uniref:Uncharacterized protein n=1 Tax=Catharanthus roseus TaxID=4058 RepID=A0ACC0BRW1_CATRO|nr:hypothetical protein M9H77_06346 [Catharanthus roseus]
MGETPTSSPGGQAWSDPAFLDPAKWTPILQLRIRGFRNTRRIGVLLDGVWITGLVSGSKGDSKGGSEMTSISIGILLRVGTLEGLSKMSLSLRHGTLWSTLPSTKRFLP